MSTLEDVSYGFAEIVLGVFVDWALVQPNGEQIMADLQQVNGVLEQEDWIGMHAGYEAAVRLMQVAEEGPFAEEMTYLFGSLVEAWGLAGV